jgi:GntR family transcriptional regulator/MocR family aminotransferase
MMVHMPRRRSARGAVLLVTLDRGSSTPMHRQIHDQLRDGIVSGRLAGGAALPSTRALAIDLRISRSTVVTAFDQLRAEGYVESLGRGSTSVTRALPEAMTRATAPARRRSRAAGQRTWSARAATLLKVPPTLGEVTGLPARAFRTSVPALDVFPVDIWGRLAARRWRRMPPAALSYSGWAGLPELRRVIADYLTRARAVRCTDAQVIVTNGSQHGLDLATRVLTDPGDTAWIEDPGYFGAAGALTANGVRLVGVPVDADGLDVAEGRRRAPNARAAFVTPARQMPLGATMSEARRQALLEWARDAGAWILEDDYDSEFRYATRPLAPLQSIDTEGAVVFLGTFSKVMFPALRLGYLVVPERLLPAFEVMRRYSDFCPPSLTQATMADFIGEGHFERHIRRMRAIYQSRRALLKALLERHLGPLVEVEAPDAGMNLIVWFQKGVRDRAMAAALTEAGIDAIPISQFTRRKLRPGLLLGYSGIREPDLRRGVAKLAEVVAPMLTGS